MVIYRIFIICLFFITFAVSGVSANDASKARGKISGGILHEMPAWFTNSFLDINEDVEEAQDDNKNILLFFHINNDCPYCDAILNENFRSGDTAAFIQQHFSVIAINVLGAREVSLNEMLNKTEKQLSKLLGVQYTPTMIFLDKQGKKVLRMNGYRAPEPFKHALNFVVEQAYKNTSLSSYIETAGKDAKRKYTFLEHASLSKTNYLKGYKKPVAILFEDEACTECEFFHNKVIGQDEVKKELDEFLFIRFDAYSDKKLIDFSGNQTTPREFVEKYGLSYRPGIILFDDMKEITRIDGKLFSFHFKEVLRYVSGGFYKKYSSYNAYLSVRRNELIEQGINIDISK